MPRFVFMAQLRLLDDFDDESTAQCTFTGSTHSTTMLRIAQWTKMSKQKNFFSNFIRTIGRHLDNLMNWIVRMGNTGVWGNDPGICKRKKDVNKKVVSF